MTNFFFLTRIFCFARRVVMSKLKCAHHTIPLYRLKGNNVNQKHSFIARKRSSPVFLDSGAKSFKLVGVFLHRVLGPPFLVRGTRAAAAGLDPQQQIRLTTCGHVVAAQNRDRKRVELGTIASELIRAQRTCDRAR